MTAQQTCPVHGIPDCSPLLNGCSRMTAPDRTKTDDTLRDSSGRLARVHGAVLDEGNPAPTLRELLRQWSESGLAPGGDLAERAQMVLEVIGPDGTVT